MSRRSTVAVSTFVPALKVRSTTLPVSTFFSVVRTKAPPLPGLTCWNAVTDHNWPSRLSTKPFFRSFVVATRGYLLGLYGGAGGGRAIGAPAPPSRAGGVLVSDAAPAPSSALQGTACTTGPGAAVGPGAGRRRIQTSRSSLVV